MGLVQANLSYLKLIFDISTCKNSKKYIYVNLNLKKKKILTHPKDLCRHYSDLISRTTKHIDDNDLFLVFYMNEKTQ